MKSVSMTCNCCGKPSQVADLTVQPPRRLCIPCYSAGCDGKQPCQVVQK